MSTKPRPHKVGAARAGQAAFEAGKNPPSFDKQFLRDWLETAQVDGKPWGKVAPPPTLPPEVIAGTVAKYQEALERLTKA